MTDDKPAAHERWYEQYPNLHYILTITENLPLSRQEAVAAQLKKILEPYQPVIRHLEQTVSMSRETFRHLEKGYEKKRWYDEFPAFHQALGLMVMLPHEVLERVDADCNPLVDMIVAMQELPDQD